MKIVYVAGPFRGANGWEIEQNVRRAEKLGYQVCHMNAMPLIPHANTRCFHGVGEDQFWLDGTMELLRRCDAVILTHDWERSKGACAEVEEANRLGLPVFHHLHQLARWLVEGRSNDGE